PLSIPYSLVPLFPPFSPSVIPNTTPPSPAFILPCKASVVSHFSHFFSACLCVSVCVCARARAHVCVCVCVCFGVLSCSLCVPLPMRFLFPDHCVSAYVGLNVVCPSRVDV